MKSRIALLFAAASAGLVLAAPTAGRVDSATASAEKVTIFARPATLGPFQRLTLYGSVATEKANETVTIQVKECRTTWFRGVAAARTLDGGGWSTDAVNPGITASIRAVWNGQASAPVTVRQRAWVTFRTLPGSSTRFEVRAWSHLRKRVQIQRYDARLGTWSTVRTVVLSEPPGVATFTASFQRGTSLRAFLSAAQAKPCFLAGTSRIVRT